MTVAEAGLVIRPAASADVAPALALALRSIRNTEGKYYTAAQVRAWASNFTVELLQESLKCESLSVAISGSEVIAFATFVESAGAFGMLYVDPPWWGRGSGRLLANQIEAEAVAAGICKLRADCGLLTAPMLAKLGYVREAIHIKSLGGVRFENYWMAKTLSADVAATTD